MSRSINKTTKAVFDIFKQYCAPYADDPTEERWIDGDPAIEGKWLAHSTLKAQLEISTDKTFLIVEYQAVTYFVSIGFADPQILPSGLNLQNLNAGLFAMLVAELKLPIKNGTTKTALENYVLSLSNKDNQYKGHDFKVLSQYFPNIVVMEATSQFGGDNNNLFQLITSYLTENKDFIVLNFSTATLNKINNLVLINSRILSYESIVQALLSSSFKFAFLDLYRCVEMLYQIVYIDDAYSKLQLTIRKSDLLNAIDECLKWKPNERNTLEKIIQATPVPDKASLTSTIKTINNGNGNVTNWVYDLRCSIVHLKSFHKKIDLKPDEWDKLLFGLSEVLQYWYQKYPTF